jgi:hypothetical protein
LGFLNEDFPLIVELDDPIHVRLHIAVTAIGLDGVQVITNEANIQHGKRFSLDR